MKTIHYLLMKQIIIQSKEDEKSRRKLITVLGQNPHMEETEERREKQNTKKSDKTKQKV
jgi:hypothetical protein